MTESERVIQQLLAEAGRLVDRQRPGKGRRSEPPT
jgi:hypothetical protein